MFNVGSLLLAPPSIDNWWEKSVILLLEDNEFGNTGVLLNKQSELSLAQLGDKLGIDIDIPGFVYIGGPVGVTSLGMIHSNDWRCSNTVPINDHVSISSSSEILKRLSYHDVPEYWRLFIGYCAWGDDKLATEISNGKWHVADSFMDLIFDYDANEQWDMAVNQAAVTFSKSILAKYNI